MVVLITSRKGGVGKTTLCANLGAAFADRGLSTVLVDCDFGVRCLDILCGTTDRVLFDIGDIVSGRADCEKAVVSVGNYTGSGIVPDMIASPYGEFGDDAQSTAGLTAMISTLSEKYGVVILDTPRDSLVRIAGCIKESRLDCTALVVVNPYETAVRAAELTGRELAELGIDDVKLVINGFDEKEMRRGNQPSIVGLIDRTSLPLIGAVPHDRTLNTEPITKNAATKRTYANIAARLCGESIPLLNGVRGLNRRKLINIQ